jgi:hypothetical protein
LIEAKKKDAAVKMAEDAKKIAADTAATAQSKVVELEKQLSEVSSFFN